MADSCRCANFPFVDENVRSRILAHLAKAKEFHALAVAESEAAERLIRATEQDAISTTRPVKPSNIVIRDPNNKTGPNLPHIDSASVVDPTLQTPAERERRGSRAPTRFNAAVTPELLVNELVRDWLKADTAAARVLVRDRAKRLARDRLIPPDALKRFTP